MAAFAAEVVNKGAPLQRCGEEVGLRQTKERKGNRQERHTVEAVRRRVSVRQHFFIL